MDPYAMFCVQEYSSRKAITGEPSNEKEPSLQYSPRMTPSLPASPRDSPTQISDYKKVCDIMHRDVCGVFFHFFNFLRRESVVALLLRRTPDYALTVVQLRLPNGEKVPLVLTRIHTVAQSFISISYRIYFSFRYH
jgi:hypothetical protein